MEDAEHPADQAHVSTVLPDGLRAEAAEAHEALYEASGPIYAAVNQGRDLLLADATVLRDALTDSIRATEKVLYGPGRAPDDAAGPPSEAHTPAGRPGQREQGDGAP